MPDRLWAVLKWALLVELVAASLWAGDVWIQSRVAARVNQSLTAYHQQYVQPLIRERDAMKGAR